jgi:hypothetical protein
MTRESVQESCGEFFAAIPLLDYLDAGGKKQIIDTLLKHCQDQAHVDAVLQYFSENAIAWKNPVAELAAIARKLERPEAQPPGCDRCALGEDPCTGLPRWAPHVPQERSNGYTSATRCSCRRGKWLAAQDAKRKAVEAAARLTAAAKPEKFDDRSDTEAN